MTEDTIHHIFSRLTRDEKRDFLIKALSDLGTESMTDILLVLPLRELPSSLKARIVFRLGITAVGHSYWLQSSNTQVWEFPLVPPALRPLITAVSRLIGEFEAAMSSAVNGRGDYAKVVVLLNPERIEELGQEIRSTVMGYAAELRSASGRNRKPARPKSQGDGKGARPDQAVVALAEGEGVAAVQDEAAGTGRVDEKIASLSVADAAESLVADVSRDSETEPQEALSSEPVEEPAAKPKRKRAAKADDATAAEESPTVISLVDVTPEADPAVDAAPDAAGTEQLAEPTAENSSFSGLFDSFLKTDES